MHLGKVYEVYKTSLSIISPKNTIVQMSCTLNSVLMLCAVTEYFQHEKGLLFRVVMIDIYAV